MLTYLRILRGGPVAVLALLPLLLLSSCSDDSTSPGGGSSSPVAVDGYVSKAVVDGSTVNLWSLTNAGGMNQLVAGPFTTNAEGYWSGEVPDGTSGRLLVVAEGGSYVDESSGGTVTLGSELYGLLDMSGAKRGVATPLSHAMLLNAQERIAGGTALATAFDEVITAIDDALGFDPTSTAPVTSTGKQGGGDEYVAFLAGISALLDGNPALSPAFDNADTWDLVMGLASDLSDGVLDGLDIGGNVVMVDSGGSGDEALPSLDGDDISALIDAANAWAATNLPGISLANVDLGEFADIDNGNGEPGEYAVNGTLAVSGPDAGQYGNPFAPTTVTLAAKQFVGGFVFNETETKVLTVTVNPTNLQPSIVNAQNLATVWNATFSIPGLTVSENGGGWTLNFSNVVLTALFGGSTITLDGTLNVTPVR